MSVVDIIHTNCKDMYFFLQKYSIPDLFIALDDTQNEVGFGAAKKNRMIKNVALL